jgi:hypothetical protein
MADVPVPEAKAWIEPQPIEFHEALQNAQTIYDFVLNLLPAEARP